MHPHHLGLGAGVGACWLVGSALALGAAASPASADTMRAPAAVPLVPVDACDTASARAESLPVSAIDDTTGAGDDVNLDETGGCAGGGTQFFGTGSGPDHAYGIRVDRDCELEIQVQPMGNADLALYVVTGCDDVAGSCLGVDDADGPDGLEAVRLAATPGTDYIVLVDGNQGSAGRYELTIRETTDTGCQLAGEAVCGDGTVEPGEACDDGNAQDGDGCSARCTIEDTGDAGAGAADAAPGPDADTGSPDAGAVGGDAGPGNPGGPADSGGGCCQSGPPTDSVPPLMLMALAWLWSRRRAARPAGLRPGGSGPGVECGKTRV